MDSSPDSLPVADDIQLSLASRMRVHLSWGAFATKSRKFTSRNQRHQEKPVQKGRDHGIPAFFRRWLCKKLNFGVALHPAVAAAFIKYASCFSNPDSQKAVVLRFFPVVGR
jgi:hypothetical protein